jgi:hypothetical protein
MTATWLSGSSQRQRHGPAVLKTAATAQAVRTVAVIGAGASKHACGLPVGQDAITHLQSQLVDVHARLLDEELDRLELESRLLRGEFETQLLALGRFAHRRLIDALHSLFARRHYPNLTYELLAHLLKHRFLDAIVNFNFDETLDQAIEDELPDGHYYRVISDSDCDQPLSDLASTKLALPLYIKPHGTASAKSSLRYTRGDYYLLPRDLKELLGLLVGGLPVRILVVGHAMNSFEFNDVLARSRHDDTRFFILAPHLRESHTALSSGHGDKPTATVDFLEVTKHKTLDEWLKDIWACIERDVSTVSRPRDVARHKLITALFSRKLDYRRPEAELTDALVEYFRDRTLVEIALAVSKAKGFVHLSQLMQGRAGAYFRLYKQESGDRSQSLLDACHRVGLSLYSGDALHLGQARHIDGGPERLIQSVDGFAKRSIPALNKALCENLSPERSERLRSHLPLAASTFRYMYEGEEVEVAVGNDAVSHEYFVDPTPLSTLTAFKLATRRLLETDWDRCLCVAETGEWLLDKAVRRFFTRDRCVSLVVADRARLRELRSLVGGRLLSVHRLQWWLHNQHMTVFLRQGVAIGAVFFERRLRTSIVSPVLLGPADAERALVRFVSYQIRAEGYARTGRDPFVEHHQVERAKQKLIKRLYERNASKAACS